VSPGGDRTVVPARDATGPEARPAGLLEKLVAAVRPEFRADVFIPDPADPVFGGRRAGSTAAAARPGRAACATATTAGGRMPASRTSLSSRPSPGPGSAGAARCCPAGSPAAVTGGGGRACARATSGPGARPASLSCRRGPPRCRRFTSRSRRPAAGSAFASCGRKVRPGCAARTGWLQLHKIPIVSADDDG
jgi:hypothetical protein